MKNTIFSFLLSSILISGCTYLEPYVQQVNLISIPQEREIGKQLEAEVAKEMILVNDPAVLAPVQTIGQRLVNKLDRHDFDYHFYVIEDKSPNAFTIPGGRIYVHTGLLKFTQDQNELAGVLAHEIGHAYARHPTRALSRAYGVEYLAQLIIGKNTQGQLKTLALNLAKGGLLSKYGRAEEYEADEIGYWLAKKSGYDTGGLLRFLRRIQNLERGGFPVPFLSSHPPTPDRIARLESFERSGPPPQYSS